MPKRDISTEGRDHFFKGLSDKAKEENELNDQRNPQNFGMLRNLKGFLIDTEEFGGVVGEMKINDPTDGKKNNLKETNMFRLKDGDLTPRTK